MIRPKLVEIVKQHRDEWHTQITDEQIKDLVSTSAYDE
jgi:hypothetical protein